MYPLKKPTANPKESKYIIELGYSIFIYLGILNEFASRHTTNKQSNLMPMGKVQNTVYSKEKQQNVEEREKLTGG